MTTRKTPLSLVDHDRLHQVELIKLPPHSVEAEQSVLGGLLLDNTAWDRIADLISESDFYRVDHRLIWRHLTALIGESKEADVITVSDALQSTGELDSIGGLAYLGALAQNTPSAANIRRYAEIVKDRAILRHIAHESTTLADLAYNPNGRAASEILDEAQQRMFALTDGAQASAGFEQIYAAMKRAIDGMGKLGMPTGFTDLDNMTGGLGAGDLVVIAGRPSMGKTAFTMNIAEYVALKLQKPVGVFSLEMPSEALAARLLTSYARVNNFKFRKDAINPEERARISTSLAALQDMPLHIDETGAISPTEVRARCRRLSRECGGLGLVIVDYLQLMDVDSLGDSRADSVGRASRELKHLAKELGCPVIVLSQLNRQVEQRPNKRPNMADLRDSGAIEQDADLILFMYRDEVYNPDSPDKGLAEVIIAKQRNGPIGMVKATWIGEIMRFENRVWQR
jgi:replicative DNA helicase